LVVPSPGVTLTVAGAVVGVLLAVLRVSVGVADARIVEAPEGADEQPDTASAAHANARA